jgi:hypothetical protein
MNRMVDDRNRIPLTLDMLVQYITDNSGGRRSMVVPESEKVDLIGGRPQQEDKFQPLRPDDKRPLNNHNHNLPPTLSKLFKDIECYRLGVSANSIKGIDNCSLVSSVINCQMHMDMSTKNISDKSVYYNAAYEHLQKSIGNDVDSKNSCKQYNWDKKSILIDIKSLTPSPRVFRIIADVYHINIFVLDIKDDTLYYNGSEIVSVHKKNIFLILHETGAVEPIIFGKLGVLDNNSDFIKYLVANPENVECRSFTGKEVKFQIGTEKLTKYISKPSIRESFREKQLLDRIKHERLSEQAAAPPPPPLSEPEQKPVIAGDCEDVGFTEIEDDEMDTVVDIEHEKNRTELQTDKNLKPKPTYTIDKLTEFKLDRLQSIAQTLNIDLVAGKTKAGKDKMKTRSDLIKEIVEK